MLQTEPEKSLNLDPSIHEPLHEAGIEPLKQIVNLFSSTLPSTKDHFEPCLNHELCHSED